jgi:hypothetical protein
MPRVTLNLPEKYIGYMNEISKMKGYEEARSNAILFSLFLTNSLLSAVQNQEVVICLYNKDTDDLHEIPVGKIWIPIMK